ncbi:MAG: class I SAM-dependent methyltransferase [Pseudomonadota bacterium]
MSTRSLGLPESLQAYVLAAFVDEPPVLARLRQETAKLANAGMQISPEQGQFMRWLVGLLGARRCLEIGVFTGYSALSVALATPDDGRVVACDVSEEWTAMARRAFEEAGVPQKLDLHIRPGLQTLALLIDGGQAGTFDFAFIDADKENYWAYYESALALLRAGGVLAVDNIFWDGKVADSSVNDERTVAIRALTAHALADGRVSASVVPVGDGLLLARKLP